MQPYTIDTLGVRVSVRVIPKSSADRIDGLYEAADGKVSLKLRVRAQPEKGKANTAVIKVLANALGVAKSDVTLTSGAKDRNKVLHVSGAPDLLSERIDALIGAA